VIKELTDFKIKVKHEPRLDVITFQNRITDSRLLNCILREITGNLSIPVLYITIWWYVLHLCVYFGL